MDNCKNCGEEVVSDGHGELVHVTDADPAGKYGCDPKSKSKTFYAVAE